MPPRARRNTARSSASDTTDIAKIVSRSMVKPNLPPLKGTPSSRRQYTYGAEVEPPPPRPGRRGQVVDLNSAVKNVLAKQAAQEKEEAAVAKPTPAKASKGRQPKKLTAADEDELASDESAFQPTPAAKRQQSVKEAPQPQPAQNQSMEGSDLDDTRSFGLESDYYGDATIGSTPGSAAPPEPSRRLFQTSSVRSDLSSSRPAGPSSLRNPAVPEEPDELEERSFTERTSRNAAGRRGRLAALASAEELLDQTGQRSKSQLENERPEQSSSDEEELVANQTTRAELRQPFKPASTRSRRGVSNASTSNQQQQPVDPPEPQPRYGLFGRPPLHPPSARKEKQELARPPSRGKSNSLTNRRQLNVETEEKRPNLFTQARGFVESVSPFSNRRHFIPSDHSEMDDAMQKDIQDDFVQERRQREAEESREAWARRWETVLSPFSEGSAFRRYTSPSNLSRLILQIIEYFRENSNEFFYGLRHGIIGQTFDMLLSATMYLTIAAIVLVIGVFLASAASNAIRQWNFVELPGSPVGMPSIPNLGDVTGRVGAWVPTMPHMPRIPWPSRSLWDEIPDFSELDESERASIDEILRKYENQLVTLTKAKRLHDDSLKKLEAIVPRVVHMEHKDGKPVIAQEFWHGLRDLIREDGDILTLDKSRNGYEMTSDQQWQAIAKRLDKDPAFATKLNQSVAQLEDRLGKKMATSWDTWVKNNNGIVADILGSELDKIHAAGSEREFEKRLTKIVKQHLAEQEHNGVVVSRDEFLRHLKNEFSSHRQEIRAELNELRPQIDKLVRDSIELATKNTPHGVTEKEVSALVSKLVRKSIADMNLQAMAKGQIHAHWDTELKNQVNYFGVASGAVVDPKHSSKTWDPMRRGVVSDKSIVLSLRSAKPFPQIMALMPWHDEGDCWCAARSVNKRGNPHGAVLSVLMGHTIIPTHLVIEHILPGATTDPGARPRDIEVYAHISDPVLRGRVRDFSATHFPDDVSDWNYMPPDLDERFVKIGQMTYEGAELHDGVSVHRLSTDLEELGAETDQVIVRAVSNYGAKEHTCFYRVRLYGQKTEPSI